MIYHITTADWWERWRREAHYESPTLAEESFIHCSTAAQVKPVLARYYAGQRDLVLLHIAPQKLQAPLRYEPSTDNELYPHVYGPINHDAIVKVEQLG